MCVRMYVYVCAHACTCVYVCAHVATQVIYGGVGWSQLVVMITQVARRVLGVFCIHYNYLFMIFRIDK